MPVQVLYSSGKPLRFWFAIAVLTIAALCWAGLRYLDETLSLARVYIAHDQLVTQKIGPVSDITLYKFRYIDPQGSADSCFARYYFYVSGQDSATLNLRVGACGSRSAATFRLEQQ